MGIGYLSSVGYRKSLDMLVVAFCRDYFERKAAIESGEISRRTRMEYEYVNARIAEAAREIDEQFYEIYIREIGEMTGYAGSKTDFISEVTYKKTKKEIKINIAKKLHLLD